MRVCQVVSNRYLSINGGVGTFIKGFHLMAKKYGWVVDIVVDSPLMRGRLHPDVEKECKVVSPKDPLAYSHHKKIFMFSDGLCFERQVNFRNALIDAIRESVYDLIIVNDEEALDPIVSLDLNVPVVYYTHNPESVLLAKKSVFNRPYQEWLLSLLSKNVVIGSQSNDNLKLIPPTSKGVCLPLPIAEPSLEYANLYPSKEGLLFIGTYQDRKNPEEFIRVVKELKCKALVMTSGSSAEKFRRSLEDNGVKEYEIRHSLTGAAKVDFISKAKVAYHPAKMETFGYGVIEEAFSCPVVVLKEMPWTLMHEKWAHLESLSSVTEKIKQLLASSRVYNNSQAVSYSRDVDETWLRFVEGVMQEKVARPLRGGLATVQETVRLDDYFSSLGRSDSFSHVGDYRTVSNNRFNTNLVITNEKNGSTLTRVGFKASKITTQRGTLDSLFD